MSLKMILMKYRGNFLYLFLIFVFFSCNKEKRKVKLQAACKTTYELVYSVNGNTPNVIEEAADWSVTFNMKPGQPFSISGLKTGPFFELGIAVYIDDVTYNVVKTTEQFEWIKIEGTVP